MHPGRAFMAGIVGALVMSLVMAGLRAAGVPLRIESELAALLGTKLWIVGLAAHLAIGGALGIVYGMAFELVLHESGVGPGVILGAQNAIIAGFVWAALGGPGHFWTAVGPQGIVALFVAHMTFGAVVGATFKAEERLHA
jgi:hypothetical protein